MGKLRFGIIGHGKMGQLVERVLHEKGESISVIIDPNTGKPWENNSLDEVDVAICFTSPDAGYETTKRVLEKGKDAVVATTKFYLNEDGSLNVGMLREFNNLARENNNRMIYASNFSVGMNAFWKHLGPLARTMAELGYDVALEERHHNRKADVSGSVKTAGMIVMEAYPGRKLSFGAGERKRGDDEITVTSTRVGYIPGTHIVVFDSPVDTIEFTHTVRDPKIFAQGAVDSAYWLRGREPGVYNMHKRL